MKFLNDIITGVDNKSVDLGRVSWILCVLAIIALQCVYTYLTKNFDVLNFGTALAATSGAHGGAIALKAGTEPTA